MKAITIIGGMQIHNNIDLRYVLWWIIMSMKQSTQEWKLIVSDDIGYSVSAYARAYAERIGVECIVVGIGDSIQCTTKHTTHLIQSDLTGDEAIEYRNQCMIHKAHTTGGRVFCLRNTRENNAFTYKAFLYAKHLNAEAYFMDKATENQVKFYQENKPTFDMLNPRTASILRKYGFEDFAQLYRGQDVRFTSLDAFDGIGHKRATEIIHVYGGTIERE